ncbi:GNAT family N-acetyltransferase [Ilumatobacter sp.]|uniref:GNAT family N-acetyltransferase n=1 Tax=Ilumatobacter sp. TaxID=1967498 RepID=UPI0037500FE8
MTLRHPSRTSAPTRLHGRRIMMRPLAAGDFRAWSEVRAHNEEWLTAWEPRRNLSLPDPTVERSAFSARCAQRDRDRTVGIAYQFGLFIDEQIAGEVNLNNVIRGAMQSGTIGYWIDQRHAGHGYVAEGVSALIRYAFDTLGLHRVEICIVPRNTKSRRVMEKLEIRDEGTAQRYLEINGEWEDHIRYGITVEEWHSRCAELINTWLG